MYCSNVDLDWRWSGVMFFQSLVLCLQNLQKEFEKIVFLL